MQAVTGRSIVEKLLGDGIIGKKLLEERNLIILVWIFLFILLVVCAAVTQNIVFFGIALLSIGVLFFYLKSKGMALAPGAVWIMGIYAVVWGLLLIAASFIDGDYVKWIFAEGLAGVFLGLGIYQGIGKAIMCRETVSAVFLGAKPHSSGRGGTFYEPYFSYKYHNHQYQRSTGEVFRKRKLEKRYQEGKNCIIYMNPKNPNVICTKRYPQNASILMICIGVVFACVPFLEK